MITKFLTKLRRIILVSWYGEFKSRALRCNKRTCSECACGKILFLSKRAYKVNQEIGETDKSFLRIHTAMNKIEKSTELIKENSENKDYSVMFISTFGYGDNAVRFIYNLTETEAKNSINNIIYNEAPIYIEAIKNGKVVQEICHPMIHMAAKC